MSEYDTVYSVKQLAETLKVKRSGYYLHEQESGRSKENAVLAIEIHRVFKEHKKNYGSPRITTQLRQEGWGCGENRVARIMRKEDLCAYPPKSKRPKTTDSSHGGPIAPNRLKGMEITGPNQAWAMDITYLPTRAGWAYLAAVLDLYGRKVVGWELGEHLDATLVVSALERAQATRQASPGLLVHSDRGCQYASKAFLGCIGRHRFEPSMSAKGNCYDNATMESFFGTLKREEIDKLDIADLAEARQSVFSYIETYYNRKRIHTSLGGTNPEAYEKQWEAGDGFSEAWEAPAGQGKKKAEESLPRPRPSVATSCYSLEGCFPAAPSSASQDDRQQPNLMDSSNSNLTEQEITNPSGV